MQYYLRFLLYNGPDRQATTQIHSDIPVDEPAQFGYGQGLRIGSDSDDPQTWPQYVVAHITHGKQIKDPNDESKNALLFINYVAPLDQWHLYSPPEELKPENIIRMGDLEEITGRIND